MTDPTAPAAPMTVVAADVGKTRCRLAICAVHGAHIEVVEQADVAGVPGLATAPETTHTHVLQALALLDPQRVGDVAAYGIGAAGARLAPDAAVALADRLADERGRPVVVGSDVLAAHLGALGGAAGTVTIAGTGAVAYHVGRDGEPSMADGWGPVIGDLGGGFWFGMTGLQAALAGEDGRGPVTALTRRARAWAPEGSLLRLPSVVADAGFSRRVADFARAVLEEAEAGDAVALAVRDSGVRHLATTTAAVADLELPVSVVGGLADNAGFAVALQHALAARGLEPRAPLGAGLAGAAIMGAWATGAHGSLPHEPHLHRSRRH